MIKIELYGEFFVFITCNVYTYFRKLKSLSSTEFRKILRKESKFLKIHAKQN